MNGKKRGLLERGREHTLIGAMILAFQGLIFVAAVIGVAHQNCVYSSYPRLPREQFEKQSRPHEIHLLPSSRPRTVHIRIAKALRSITNKLHLSRSE